jgi:anti-anti-sigma factor
MDSCGLRSVLAIHSRAGDAVRLVVICPSGRARRVFELAGVDRALTIYDDQSSADADTVNRG